MKLRQIEIENFGIFSGRKIEFGEPGFHFIYGPNESGKSTLLQLLREVLFGFAVQNPYAFKDIQGEIAATVLVDTAANAQVRFRRRKGSKNTLVGEIVGSGSAVDESIWKRFLGGATLALYQNVFAFSLAELATGEKSIKDANVSDALFGGGLGGLANFQRAQKEIQDECAALYRAGRGGSRIKEICEQIHANKQALNEATIRPTKYKALAAEENHMRENAEALRSRLEDLRKRRAHVERLSNSLEPWLTLQAIESELSNLRVPEGFPSNGEATFTQLENGRARLEAELTTEQQSADALESQLKALVLNPTLGERQHDVRRLAQEIAQVEGYRRDLPLRRAEADTIRREAAATLRELNPAWDLAALDRLRIDSAQREAVRALIADAKAIETRENELRTELRSSESDIRRSEDTLRALGDVSEVATLEVLVDEYPSHVQHEKRAAELREELDEIESDLGAAEATLKASLPSASLDRDALPLLESGIAEYCDRFDSNDHTVEKATERVEEARADLVEKESQLRRLDASHRAPSLIDLREARADRDQGWHAIRSRFIDGTPVEETNDTWTSTSKTDIGPRFENAVIKADQLADERQEKAEDVAREATLRGDIEASRERLNKLEDALKKAQRAAATLASEWKKRWLTLGADPLPPHEMLEWTRGFNRFRDLTQKRDRLRSQLSETEERVSDFASRLRAVVASPEKSVAAVVAIAKQTVKVAREARSKRDSAHETLVVQQRKMQESNTAMVDLSKRREELNERTRSVAHSIGLDPAWDIAAIQSCLESLRTLRLKLQPATDLDVRVHDMTEGLARFDGEVGALCKSLAPELAERHAEDAARLLGERIDAARQAATEHAGLTTQLQTSRRRAESLRLELDRVERNIAELLHSAGADSGTAFLETARLAARRDELEREASALRRTLHVARGGEPETEFTDTLRAANRDSLDADARRLDDELSDADASETATRDLWLDARKALDEINKEGEATRLSLEIEGLRGTLASAVDRWAALALAETLLEQAIKTFEREHQPEMLREVSRLFSAMTAGRYTAVTRKLDEHGTLLVQSPDETTKHPHELSTGTREQLYLAIRLAYVMHYCKQAEPLPIIMDDVLVNFDDARATQTLQVLRDISRHIQIIFLSCHESMADKIKLVLPDVQKIELG